MTRYTIYKIQKKEYNNTHPVLREVLMHERHVCQFLMMNAAENAPSKFDSKPGDLVPHENPYVTRYLGWLDGWKAIERSVGKLDKVRDIRAAFLVTTGIGYLHSSMPPYEDLQAKRWIFIIHRYSMTYLFSNRAFSIEPLRRYLVCGENLNKMMKKDLGSMVESYKEEDCFCVNDQKVYTIKNVVRFEGQGFVRFMGMPGMPVEGGKTT